MDIYFVVKTIHIVSAAILFGTGLGIAFFFFFANQNNNIAGRYLVARGTVLADFIFTLPAVIVQPLTGFWLLAHSGYSGTDLWLVATYVLYIVAGLCWLPVVWIQIKLKRILKNSLDRKKPLPSQYHRLFRLWFLLGWPAFIGLVVVFFLMVLKPA